MRLPPRQWPKVGLGAVKITDIIDKYNNNTNIPKKYFGRKFKYERSRLHMQV